MGLASILDFERMSSGRVNYLHYGAALDDYGHLASGDGLVSKTEFVSAISSSKSVAPVLRDLIEGYQPGDGVIDLESFRRDLDATLAWRRQFRAMGARGFSYEVDSEMRTYDHAFVEGSKLDRRVNIRLALMPGSSLFYPPRIRSYLRSVAWRDNHYFRNQMPSIAFALGVRRDDGWYVLAMQSDLTSRGPAYVREHFRGWRAVLFANVLARARVDTPTVYLCRAEDVERARVRPREGRLPISTLWAEIYDGTASEWGMQMACVRAPIDVQVLRGRTPVFTTRFHAFQIASRVEPPDSSASEVLCTATL